MIPAILALITQTPLPEYAKLEYAIPMRDGTKLYTSVCYPKNVPGRHPILLERTPYSSVPYEPNKLPEFVGSPKFRQQGYIFVTQDVRGQYMSGGSYMNIRPLLDPGVKGVDERTDTWDTVDYLVKHVPNNNGAVGLWGISYPGFYAGIAGIDTHPAVKAISPQAPVSDWFIGDDLHHNGAFFLQDNFDFIAWFDKPRAGLEKDHKELTVDRKGQGAYSFFLKTGPLANFDKQYFKGQIPYWNEILSHGTYDAYWKARALPPRMKGVRCAVLTVGGWFDAEDQWGALNLYASTERQNPGIVNALVMGPWYHGMWSDTGGNTFGDLNFGMPTSQQFQETIEFPFFEKYLNAKDINAPAEATMFETGANRWRTFSEWPPKGLEHRSLYMQNARALSFEIPTTDGFDRYLNDPARPTPYLGLPETPTRPAEYMVADQRWAEKRADVVTYKGPVQDAPLTMAGPIDVDLWVSTTGTDADFIVKVIDVWPLDSKDVTPSGKPMAGYQLLVRGDVMRGKFRNSFETPEPFVPGEATRVKFRLNDVLHTFKKGHRIVVQVQSSWFPLVDRNPNKFVDIYTAKESDFEQATISILRDPKHASAITFGTL